MSCGCGFLELIRDSPTTAFPFRSRAHRSRREEATLERRLQRPLIGPIRNIQRYAATGHGMNGLRRIERTHTVPARRTAVRPNAVGVGFEPP